MLPWKPELAWVVGYHQKTTGQWSRDRYIVVIKYIKISSDALFCAAILSTFPFYWSHLAVWPCSSTYVNPLIRLYYTSLRLFQVFFKSFSSPYTIFYLSFFLDITLTISPPCSLFLIFRSYFFSCFFSPLRCVHLISVYYHNSLHILPCHIILLFTTTGLPSLLCLLYLKFPPHHYLYILLYHIVLSFIFVLFPVILTFLISRSTSTSPESPIP